MLFTTFEFFNKNIFEKYFFRLVNQQQGERLNKGKFLLNDF